MNNKSVPLYILDFLMIVLGGMLLYAMLYPMITRADFGEIDDHEIALFLGSDGHLTLADTVSLIRERALETNGRFRPGYYVLRILETYIFGLDASFWYWSRLLLAWMCFGGLFFSSRIFLPAPLAAAVASLFFMGPQNEIWIRLGPNEAYGAPLLIWGMWAVIRALKLGQRRLWPYAWGLFAILGCGFIKESFIPYLPSVLLLLYGLLPLWRKECRLYSPFRDRHDLGILIVLMVGIALQLAGVAYGLSTYGHVYKESHSLASLWNAWNYFFFKMPQEGGYPIIACGLVLCARLIYHQRKSIPLKELYIWITGIVAIIVLFFLPQLVIYGTGTLVPRYLVPAILAVQMAVTLSFFMIMNAQATWKGWHSLRMILCIGLTIPFFIHLYSSAMDTHGAAEGEASKTQAFQSRIRQILYLHAQFPQDPIVFRSEQNSWDYEGLISTKRYLVAHNIGAKPFLLFTRQPSSGLTETLNEQFFRIMNEGLEGFEKISQLHVQGKNCIEVRFSVARPSFCDHVVGSR